MKSLVIDLGGSIVAPEQLEPDFLYEFKTLLRTWLDEDSRRVLGLVVGGGAAARKYQAALRNIPKTKFEDRDLDLIGIAATKLNAEFMRILWGSYCKNDIIDDYSKFPSEYARVIIGAGWQVGVSTDYDAVLMAEHLGCKDLLCLSNISKIYSSDPKKDPRARALDKLSWREYRELTETEWKPGLNTPFDPQAAIRAQSLNLKLTFADGRDLDNLTKILKSEPAVATIIG